MSKASMPKPQYSIWNALSAALALSMRAIEEVRALARLPGPQGPPGPRGKDGFSLNDFDVTSPDWGRTLIFTFTQGKDVQSRIVKTATPLYQGIWEARAYDAGDEVTRDGSIWIALQPTLASDQPGSGSKTWKLANKKGRDGRDGATGNKGDKGEPGRDGRDLTQMGPDGRKW